MRKINQGYLKCKKKVSPVKTFKLEKQASKLLNRNYRQLQVYYLFYFCRVPGFLEKEPRFITV